MLKNNFKILLAEDDSNLSKLLKEYILSEGYDVVLAENGEIAFKEFKRSHFDLCLFDIMMPVMDGYTLAKEIRKTNTSVPIIFITARSMKDDKFKAYDIGATDYITKPFDEEELLWKLKAYAKLSSKMNADVVRIGKYIFNHQNQSLNYKDSIIRITEKESAILEVLHRHKNKLVKREQLLKEVWGENDYFLGRSLDVFISKIRKYLNEDPDVSIENVFGAGFILNIPE